MNDMQAFASGVYSFGTVSSRSLSGMQPDSATHSITPDGSKFFTDCDGDIIYAQYASGAIVSKQSKHIAVRTADGDYWMGNFEGRWFRVD
ncbi:MAG: hypothetical protein C0469_03850 [Cyanobacteria bacterium DS2.3.42]|nr:hypothetical protein [Cyanobacteria bacterium DS2.3.42]